MAERKRLGLIFTVNVNWMGGTYYILNLINSFNYLEDEKKPAVVLLCSSEKDFEYAREYTHYPFMTYQIFYKKLSVFDRIANKITRHTLGRNIKTPYCKKHIKDIDIIYPIQSRDLKLTGVTNIGWIPDFQEKYLPELFSSATIEYRDKNSRFLRDSGMTVVLSSNDARNDYQRFYDAPTKRTSVFRFSSKIPSFNSDEEKILGKYNVDKDNYFFCGNQFWVHKNHMTLFKSIKRLKDEGYSPTLLCTGNPKDNRAVGYYEKLLQYIEDHHLQENIRLLGLIDRNDQLTLMKNCKAVIQPSLFEGWNTSIEEAKAMNKLMIVSDLNVHKEQVERNSLFFKRNDANDLADKMRIIIDGNFTEENYDYSISIKESAETFMKIIEDCIAENNNRNQ